MATVRTYRSNDKGVLYINGVNFIYDYRIVCDTGIYYINIDLCGSGGSAKNKMGSELHKLTLSDGHSIQEVIDIINVYNHLYCYKVIKLNNIYIMYICPYEYFTLIKDTDKTERFTDLE